MSISLFRFPPCLEVHAVAWGCEVAAARLGVSAVALRAVADKSVACGSVVASQLGESALKRERIGAERLAYSQHRLTETPALPECGEGGRVRA